MPSKTMLALAIGIIALAGAFVLPVFLDATTSDASQTVILETNESAELTDTLRMDLNDVYAGPNYTDNATVALVNQRTLDSTNAVINDTENATLSLSGENTTVAVDLRTADSAMLQASYPPTFAWGSGASAIVNNLPVLLMIALTIIVLATLGIRI